MNVIENLTPLAVGLMPSHDRNGRAQSVVVVKGTFDRQGRVAERERVPVLTADVYFDEPEYPRHCIRFEADWASVKPLTDLIVNGFAYPPGQRPASQFEVSLQVGGNRPVHARVFGPRYWRKVLGWSLSNAAPVERVALACLAPGHELAAHPQKTMASPVQWSGDISRAPDEAVTPAGFGTYDRAWSPRLGYAGSYPGKGKDCAPGLESRMPPNFDERYWNCAHPKLQFERSSVEPGARIRLQNMSADGQFDVTLPGIAPVISMTNGAHVETIRPGFDTVIVEPEADRLILVWRHVIAGTPIALANPVTVHLDHV
ncbi:MAG: DUF2169 domain-containing protein [Desulfovibrionaceae bacterium]|nr:DUF2169 domain-containing protein [Desulfovibrionaceae bacterium]